MLIIRFSGPHCEISSCHNYCLEGDCFVNNRGEPSCKCSASYTGNRCEVNLCTGYCLNDGICSIQNNKPTCECKYTNGARCENSIDMGEICGLYCMNRPAVLNSLDISSCR